MMLKESIMNEEASAPPRVFTSSYRGPQSLLGQMTKISEKQKTKSMRSGIIDSIAGEQILLEAVQNNDLEYIEGILAEAENINVHKVRDGKGYTLLHTAAYNNNTQVVERLISHVKGQYKQKAKLELSNWVNKQTDDGFAAFHFASYRGNIELLQMLEQNGANPFLLNQQGMNGLHIAAQGDQPKALVYFKQIGLDFSQRDNKGGTALHWAAYYGAENAIAYLLSFKKLMIDSTDKEGLTPLHLAAMTGNARIVKKLIQKGANKNILSDKLLSPAAIAAQNSFPHIYAILTQKQNFLVQYFSITQGASERSKIQMIKFILMFVYVLSVNGYKLYIDYTDWMIISYAIFETWNLLQFVLLYLSNPGKLPKKDNQELFKLLLHNEVYDVCPDCVIKRPPRSKHCDLCGICVTVYDHHCPWVDNCIGSKNHFQFYVFIWLMVISISINLPISIFIITHMQSVLFYILLSFSIAIMALFFIPLWFLLIVQTKNLILGKTTYERYSKNAKRSSVAQDEPSCQNCLDILFLNRNNPELTMKPANKLEQSLQLREPLMK